MKNLIKSRTWKNKEIFLGRRNVRCNPENIVKSINLRKINLFGKKISSVIAEYFSLSYLCSSLVAYNQIIDRLFSQLYGMYYIHILINITP